MIALSIIGFILIAIAAVSEAVMDKLQFHFDKSTFKENKNQLFWNPQESWKNKWKEDLKTEKFPGSSTIFVFTTDAWHLFKFIRTSCLFIGLPLLYGSGLSIITSMILARIIFGSVFTLYFDVIFRNNN